MVSKFISTMKASSLRLQLIDDLDEMAHGPSEPLQLGGHQHTAIAKVVDGCLESARAGHTVHVPQIAEHLLATRRQQISALGVDGAAKSSGSGKTPLAQSGCSAAAGDLWGWVMCCYAELGTVATGARSNSLI